MMLRTQDVNANNFRVVYWVKVISSSHPDFDCVNDSNKGDTWLASDGDFAFFEREGFEDAHELPTRDAAVLFSSRSPRAGDSTFRVQEVSTNP